MNLVDIYQKMAVETTAPEALVLAGAGSGKTRVLVERIAHLMTHKNVSPHEIMAFTFTRKAAGELRTRLDVRVGPAAHQITCGTMHAVALRFLHRMGEKIGMKNHTTVYCDWEERTLLKELAIEKGFFKRTWKVKKGKIDEAFNRFYQEGEAPGKDHPAHILFQSFMDRCRENNAVTYGMILTAFKQLLPHLSQFYHYKYLFVDEVQDIDRLQWEIIRLVSALFDARLFLVGDIDQSIYEWRGAVPGELIKVANSMVNFRLEANYRSNTNIVDAANRVIVHNKERITKTMYSKGANVGGIVYMTECDTAKLIGVIKAFDEKTTPGGLAVLARNHILLKRLSEELGEYPHIYIGQKGSLLNTEDARTFLAFLKLAVNPYDNFAFMLIRRLLGVADKQYQIIRYKAIIGGTSHFLVWRDQITDDNNEAHAWFKYVPTVNTVEQQLNSLFWSMCDSAAEYSPVIKICKGWATENPKGTTESLLRWLATYDLQDEIPEKEKEPPLMLMTIHAAKGLEWPRVILAGLNEGLLPSKQSISNGDIEAETRLMYVATTRAKSHLIVTSRPEKTVSAQGREYKNPISRYVDWMIEGNVA